MADEVAAAPVVPQKTGLFYKDGKFSKTAMFASICNIIVLLTYCFQSWFVGTVLGSGFVHFTVPAFDVGNATALLAILNGTYLGNNVIKSRAAAPVADADGQGS